MIGDAKMSKQLDENMKENLITDGSELRFLSPDDSNIRVSGFMAYDTEHQLRRLPEYERKLFQMVNPCLVELGEHTVGGQISFRSDTKQVVIKAKLKEVHNMMNMTPVGQCGFDCYIGKDRQHLKFFGITKYNCKENHYECQIVDSNIINSINQQAIDQGIETKEAQWNEFLINFPLYSGVESIEIGIDENASVKKPQGFSKEGQLVFYGTSITQGGCASRPGMAYTNIVSRNLNLDHLNFGFSGNGLGEYEVAEMLAKVEKPLMYIIDYEANSGTNGRMVASLEGFVKRIRKCHKETPILVLSRIPYTLDYINPSYKEQRDKLRTFQSDIVTKFSNEGDPNIYFYDGTKLFPEEFEEFTVDFIHPTDLGFYFMAKNLLPELKKILHL